MLLCWNLFRRNPTLIGSAWALSVRFDIQSSIYRQRRIISTNNQHWKWILVLWKRTLLRNVFLTLWEFLHFSNGLPLALVLECIVRVMSVADSNLPMLVNWDDVSAKFVSRICSIVTGRAKLEDNKSLAISLHVVDCLLQFRCPSIIIIITLFFSFYWARDACSCFIVKNIRRWCVAMSLSTH